MNKNDALDLINRVLENLNDEINIGIDISNGGDTLIYDEDSPLDSVGLVSLIVAIEEEIEEKYETSLILANESALSKSNNPFKTINTIADYIMLLYKRHDKK